MKLSDKGFNRVYTDLIFGDESVQDYEFEPDDFEDVLMLTVDEANRWMRILYDNAEHLDCLYECCKDDYLFLQELSNRIKEVETKNE